MKKNVFKWQSICIVSSFLVSMFFSFNPSANAAEKIKFAMLPQMANTKIFKKWKPMLEYIEKETGIKIEHVFPKDFDEHVKLCREGKIDLAYSNPVTYCQIAIKGKERKKGHVAFGVAKTEKGTKDFYGLFIIRADNREIKEFTDIKGKNGWIVGWRSAGGYNFQQAHALQKGLDLKEDCKITVSPNNKQEKVIMAVYNRQTDFGCIRNGMLEMVKGRINLNQIKVLEETTHHPAWALSMYSKVKPKIAKKIKKAMINMPEDLVVSSELPGKVKQFAETGDADFNSIRTVLDAVKSEY